MAPTPEISVVIPSFNEAENIAPAIDAVAKALEGVAWEVVVVDDDSPDGTAERVKEIARGDPRVRCLRRVNRRGLSGACIEGMLSSSAPYLAVMDADLQHDASILPKLLQALRSGEAELAIGSRYVSGGGIGAGLSPMRARISRWGIRLARRMLRTEVCDLMSGYFAIRRDRFDASAVRLSPSGFKILMDIIASANPRLRTVEVAYTFQQRRAGESKLGARVALDFLALLIEKATAGRIPTRFVFFSINGASGLVVHLAVLRLALITTLEMSFASAQALATLVAMTSNFFLNNSITYRDQRLKGGAIVRGLIGFYLVCALGAIANVGVAMRIHEVAPIWWLAGVAGAAISAVWNYSVSSLFVWSARN